MIRTVCIGVLILVILSGCSSWSGEDAFVENISEMEQSIDKTDWETVTRQAEKLMNQYEHHKWKIQLLGDEGEYERLYESINRLRAAIDDQNMADVKLEVASVKALLEDIYSL